MLTGLKIGNFKAFGETQHIPIRPLTLIFGANSSGKSSIIQALLLMDHALHTGEWNVHQPRLTGDSIDLGGIGCFVHRRRLDSHVQLGVRLAAEQLASPEAWLDSGLEIRLEVGAGRNQIGAPGRQRRASLIRASISVGDRAFLTAKQRLAEGILNAIFGGLQEVQAEYVTRARRLKSQYEVEELHTDHPLFAELVEDWRQAVKDGTRTSLPDVRDAAEQMQRVRPNLGIQSDPGRLVPSRMLDHRSAEDGAPQVDAAAASESLFGSMDQYFLRALSKLLDSADRRLAGCINRLVYLGPLRAFPPRWLSSARETDVGWNSGGGAAWLTLRDDESLRKNLNEWLQREDRLNTGYCLETRKFICPREAEQLLISTIQDLWESKPERFSRSSFDSEYLAKEIIDTMEKNERLEQVEDVVLLDRRTDTAVNHRDVGVGVSQVVPVLVNALANQKRIVAIEQPEIHLHPKLQAELGDVFIESALGERKNTFLLETHSEHLILRIMRRIRETTAGRADYPTGLPKVTPADVAVLYVEPTPAGSIVREMRLDQRGRLIDVWPGGFFEEAFNELF